MMIKKLLFPFVLVIFTFGIIFSGRCEEEEQEKIIISTYYPSPKGVYSTLRLVPRARPPDSGKPGQLCFIDGTDVTYSKGLYAYVDDIEGWTPVGGDVESGLPLVNSAHTAGDCIKAGGEVVDTDTGFQQCRFDRETCPSGWTQYKYYSTCEAASCSSPDGYTGACSTRAKSWHNASYSIGSSPGSGVYCPPVDCPVCYYRFNYWGGGYPSCCYASKGAHSPQRLSGKRIQIGCY